MQVKSEEMLARQVKGEDVQDIKPGVGGKIRIVNELDIRRAASDMLLQFSAPNIYTGANLFYFEQLIAMMDGEWLEMQLGNFYGSAAGQINLIDISGTACFKCLAISLLPVDFTSDDGALFDLYLGYRNALDKAAEEGFKSVAFIHPTVPYLLEELAIIRTALCTIGDWLSSSVYADEIRMVSVVCDDEMTYYRYRRYHQEMATRDDPFGINPRLRALLEMEPLKMEEGEVDLGEGLSIEMVEEMLQGEIRRYVATSIVHEPPIAIDPEDAAEWGRLLEMPAMIQQAQNQLYEQLFRPQGMTNIQLSSHLKRRVLLVEQEETGSVWAMRYTYAHGEFGQTLHFVCASCDSACRNTGYIKRCFALVVNGVLDHHPEDHHPECHPVSKSEIIKVQLRRRLKLYGELTKMIAEEGLFETDTQPEQVVKQEDAEQDEQKEEPNFTPFA